MTYCKTLNRRTFGLGLVATSMLSACAGGPPPARFRQEAQADTRVALLLPLSGAHAALGQQMAKTVWLVEDMSGQRGRTQVLDAGETPQAAAESARKAIAQGANIIVGPLFRDQTPAVVQTAAGVPVMTLSNDITLASSGAWVFGVTPSQSAEAVLRYAKQSGAKQVTMLETPGALGPRALAAIRQGARAARIKPLPSVPATTSPDQMRQALAQVGNGTLPDIIYVPSSGKQTLDQAVAAVRTGVTTIGSLQWAGLPSKTFARLDKACFIGPDPARFNQMSATYRAQLDEEMGVIAALAVDAVAVAQTIGATGKLHQGKPVDGLLGTTKFRSDRTCERSLAVLRITGTEVQRVA